VDRRSFARIVACGAASTVTATNTENAEAQPNEPRVDSDAAPSIAAQAPPGEAVCAADFRALAEAKLPRAAFDYIDSGSTEQVTLRENTAAFQRLKLLPPLLTGVARTDLATTVLGVPVKLPILLAPAAAQRMYHPEGALASARAAAAMSTIFGVSSSVMNSVEECAAASDGPKWFQMYVPKDRTVARKLVERAEHAGYKALVITVDLGEWKDADRRNRFKVPADMLRKNLRDLGYADITDAMTHAELIAYAASAVDLAFSWDIFPWLRSITKLPLVIKGVLRPEDARRAVELGLDGIVVSNHGGRRLDGMPASIEMLPAVAEAVAGRCEIFLDSGVRRGTDVLKALALGARAVLIGRPYVWALAADGEAGVAKVLTILRDELENVLLSAGCSNVREVPRALVMDRVP
jgi:4-hydroxymandelate oxidase